MHQHFDSLRLWAINIGSIALTATNIEFGLKILVLTASFGYTVHKWLLLHSNEKDKDHD